VPRLIELLGHDSGETTGYESKPINVTASSCLVEIGPAAVPRLAAALDEDNARVRALAAQALGLIGPESKPAVRALVNDSTTSGGRRSFAVAWYMSSVSARQRCARWARSGWARRPPFRSSYSGSSGSCRWTNRLFLETRLI